MPNELSAAGVEFLVIGAHALAAHIITEPAGAEFEEAWPRRITVERLENQ